MLDLNVDILLVRDLDSTISSREVEAVKEFINSSTKDFHIMRDHPNHQKPIMGGLFGVKLTGSSRQKYEKILMTVLSDQEHSRAPRSQRDHDQFLLTKHFWPEVRNDALMHDSYTCQNYWNTQPFPTQREKNTVGNFVGAILYKGQKVPKPCPKQCRPYNHQDWDLC